MIGWLSNKTEFLAKRFVHERIVRNQIYARLKWSLLERNVVRLASSPVKSVMMMAVVSLVIIFFGYICETPIKTYLSPYFPYRHFIIDWQMTILSGQLTIIGIVYPLVIGLVSVVFQKKADRKIAQNAYQRYSGFMLAGLSGLFLSAFVLIGLLIRMVFGDYLYGVVCLLSVVWLFTNIVLSIWFFFVSLEILDDAKRQAIIKRYIAFGIVEPYVNDKISARLRIYPVYPVREFSNIEFNISDQSNENKSVFGDFLKNDVLSLHHRPFQLILTLINYRLRKKGMFASYSVENNYLVSETSDRKVIFSVQNLDSENLLIELLKLCFYKVEIRRGGDTVNVIMQALTADIYSCLRESDSGGFDSAADSLVENFTSLCDLYHFDENGIDNNFLLITTELFEFSIPQAFSNEIYNISIKTMDMITESERFFELCLWSGVRTLNNREYLTSEELGIYMGITRSFWSTLTTWNKDNQPLSTATIRARYDRLIRTYASVWERYQESVISRFKNIENANLFFLFCETQLQDLPVMVIDALQTRDHVTVDAAVDLLNRWQHSMDIDSHTLEKYSYQGQLFSPGLFKMKNLNCITDNDWFNIAFMNALTDTRIFVTLYLTSRMAAPDDLVTRNINLILQGQLADQTGGYETRSEEINDAGQLIKSLIRICLWTWTEKMDSSAWLNRLARRMSDYDKPDMISGRVYSGGFDSDFIDMAQAWVQILLIVCDKDSRVSNDIKEAIEDDYITYREKQRLIGVLSGIQSQIDKAECYYHLKGENAPSAKDKLRTILQLHIDMLNDNLAMQLKEAVIDAARLENTARKTTEYMLKRIQAPIPLSLFRLTQSIKTATEGFMERKSIIHIDKESYAEGIDAIPAANEGDFQAECVVSDIQRFVINKLIKVGADRNIIIQDFYMMIDHIKSSPHMAGKYVLVMSRDIFQQYNNSIFESPDLRNVMKTNRDGSRTVTTEFGTCNLFFMPYVNKPLSLVVEEDYFSALSFREYETGNLVAVTSDNVRSESDRFDLILKYEVNVTFKGDAGLKIEHPQRAESD
ncbi:MAG: MFS transporter [Erwinia billingiae]